MRAKGKAEAVGVFEPLGPSEGLSKATRDTLKLWNEALRCYRAQDWDQADVALLNLQRMEGESKLIALYQARLARLRKSPPPADWDGVTTFDTK